MASQSSRSESPKERGAGSRSGSRSSKKSQAEAAQPALSQKQQEREKTTAMMLRPRNSVKQCAEEAAKQVEKKRSHIDEEAYIIGILLIVLKNRRKAEVIGTYSRHQAAECLESVFEGLFELLYEQGMLPLAHQLLIARGGSALSGDTTPGSPLKMLQQSEEKKSRIVEEQTLPLLSSTAQKAFEGMPGGADGF